MSYDDPVWETEQRHKHCREIEQKLRTDNERLRAALKPFAEQDVDKMMSLEELDLDKEHFYEARRALEQSGGK